MWLGLTTLHPQRWRLYLPPKLLSKSARMHYVTTKKTIRSRYALHKKVRWDTSTIYFMSTGYACISSKTRNTEHDTCKSAPNIRKKWPRYRKKIYKKIITGHGEKKMLKKCAVK
jgi:hypothetical protein